MGINTLFIQSCDKSDTNSAPGGVDTYAVTIQAVQFHPFALTVLVGGRVTWTNTATDAHSVVSDDGISFNSGTINPGGTFTFTAATNGMYPYHCGIHPSVQGTLQVVSR